MTLILSEDRAVRETQKRVFAVLLLVAAAVTAVVIVGSILVGGAAAEEVHNGTVAIENETDSVYVNVEFANVSDANATSTVIVTDSDGSEIANTTVSGNSTETVTRQWALIDSDPHGAYTVAVDAVNGTVADVGAGATSDADGSASGGGAAGLLEGDSRMLWAAGAVVIVGLALARRAEQ